MFKKLIVGSIITLTLVFILLFSIEFYLDHKEVKLGELDDFTKTYLMLKGKSSDLVFYQGSFRMTFDKDEVVKSFIVSLQRLTLVEDIFYTKDKGIITQTGGNIYNTRFFDDVTLNEVETCIVYAMNQLSIPDSLKEREEVDVTLTTQLTKDFQFDINDNFDKKLYIYNMQTQEFRLLEDKEIVKAGAIKLVFNRDDERFMAIFAYL